MTEQIWIRPNGNIVTRHEPGAGWAFAEQRRGFGENHNELPADAIELVPASGYGWYSQELNAAREELRALKDPAFAGEGLTAGALRMAAHVVERTAVPFEKGGQGDLHPRSARDLRDEADRIDAETQVKALASAIAKADPDHLGGGYSDKAESYMVAARALVDAGWRKEVKA